ncbi:hypothetical protein DITRI_Ditri20bG0045200 [Diplodiscus trichospermus]
MSSFREKLKKVDNGSFKMSSFHEKLKKVDDGSFDELVKKIERQTDDKAKREKLLTETVLHNFMRRCAINGQKERENLKASSQVPQKLKNFIELMQASEPVFVIEKRLNNSDLNEKRSRLSMPESEINADRFLTGREIERLNKDKALPVTLLEFYDASVEETILRLRKRRSNYMLCEKWSEVVKRNPGKFRSADGVNAVIRLWSFRHGSRLHFALYVEGEEARNGGPSDDIGSSSSGVGGASGTASRKSAPPISPLLKR